MQERRRKFLSLVLAALLVLSLVPMTLTATAEETPDQHTHDENWIALTQASLATLKEDTSYVPVKDNQTKYYYLDEDIDLDASIKIGAGTLNLCLNGHVIKWVSERPNEVFRLTGADSYLNLMDCNKTATHKFRVEESGLWVLDEVNGTKTVTGGVITGSHIGIGLHTYSTCRMYGGSIVGNNNDDDECCIYVNEHAHFTMYGGNILGCISEEDNDTTAIYGNNSTITLLGGTIAENVGGDSIVYSYECDTTLADVTICNNTPAQNAAVLAYACEDDGSLTLGGDLKIYGNTVRGDQKNLLFCDSESRNDDLFPFEIDAENPLTATALIGVSSSRSLSKNETSVPFALEGGADLMKHFFPDDPACYVKDVEGKLVLASRLNAQPSEANGYKFDLISDGAESVSYRWYRCDVTTTALTNETTTAPWGQEEWYGTYDPATGIWTPTYDGSDFLFFQVEMDTGDVVRFTAVIDEAAMTPEACFGVYDDDTGAYAFASSDGDEYAATAPADGNFVIGGGCFGDSATVEQVRIKNARRESTRMGDAVEGQTTDTLNTKESGTYLCLATVTFADGTTGSFYSDGITLELPPYIAVEKTAGAAAPVSGTAVSAQSLFRVTMFNFDTANAKVEWKQADGSWSTTAPAGVTLTVDGLLTTTAAAEAGTYTFRVTDGVAETDEAFASATGSFEITEAEPEVTPETEPETEPEEDGPFLIILFAGLACALVSAGSYLLVKFLRKKKEDQ